MTFNTLVSPATIEIIIILNPATTSITFKPKSKTYHKKRTKLTTQNYKKRKGLLGKLTKPSTYKYENSAVNEKKLSVISCNSIKSNS